MKLLSVKAAGFVPFGSGAADSKLLAAVVGGRRCGARVGLLSTVVRKPMVAEFETVTSDQPEVGANADFRKSPAEPERGLL